MTWKMKDSGVEWIGEMPFSWNILALKRLCNMQAGKNLTAEQITPKGKYPVYGGNGQRGFYNNFNCVGTRLLIGRQGALSGNVHKVSGEFWATEHAIITEPSKITNIGFLYYLLIGMNLNQYISSTAAQPGLAVTTIMNVKTCLPDLYEQDKISKYLDKKCAEIDAVLDKIRLSIEAYKKLKQAIITQAVTKGIRGDRPMKNSGIEWIGEVPSHWVKTKVKWLLVERKDKSDRGNEEPLSMSRKYGLIPTKNMDMVPNMASSFVGAKLVRKQDLVFNKLKAHLGVFSVSNYDGLVSPDYAVYYSSGLVDVKFLEYLFKTPQYIAEFKKKSTGIAAGLTRLYTDGLYSIYCALPPLDEQRQIVNYLNSKISEIDNIILKKEQYFAEIEAYKKSLIYEYVTGKKEVR